MNLLKFLKINLLLILSLAIISSHAAMAETFPKGSLAGHDYTANKNKSREFYFFPKGINLTQLGLIPDTFYIGKEDLPADTALRIVRKKYKNCCQLHVYNGNKLVNNFKITGFSVKNSEFWGSDSEQVLLKGRMTGDHKGSWPNFVLFKDDNSSKPGEYDTIPIDVFPKNKFKKAISADTFYGYESINSLGRTASTRRWLVAFVKEPEIPISVPEPVQKKKEIVPKKCYLAFVDRNIHSDSLKMRLVNEGGDPDPKCELKHSIDSDGDGLVEIVDILVGGSRTGSEKLIYFDGNNLKYLDSRFFH